MENEIQETINLPLRKNIFQKTMVQFGTQGSFGGNISVFFDFGIHE
jgi:hypothetical protein